MARISFTSTTEEIIGRLAGSVFQDSYIGTQIRGLSKPRNPQTQLQQLRRGNFRFLSAGWRNLSPEQKSSWITQTGTVPSALRLYIGNNINLNLAGFSIVSEYIASDFPQPFPLSIIAVNSLVFLVSSASDTTTVPDGFQLLILATVDRPVTHIFTNPSEYQPITSFAAGTSFASGIDIIDSWSEHYGIMHEESRLCIKTALINIVNGTRGQEVVTCALTSVVVANYIVDQDGTMINDGTQNLIVFP